MENLRMTIGVVVRWLACVLIVGWHVLVFQNVVSHGSIFRGEADDYTAPVASLLNDHDFAISADDLSLYRKLFPEWDHLVDRFEFSSFRTRDGDEVLTWYIPVYALACLPLVKILPLLGVSAAYAFCCTNYILFALAMVVVWVRLRVPRGLRLLLILLLSIHPVVFYLCWPSAEVLLYALVVMSLVFWHGASFRKAVFFMSIAAMLNPALLIAASAIVVDDLRVKSKQGDLKLFSPGCFRESAILMGCGLLAVIPLAYNFYHTGHANLTASLEVYYASGTFSSIKGLLSVFRRFIAYLFDLNYGFLPYFPVAFPLFVIMVSVAVFKKRHGNLIMPVAFLGIVVFYSVMSHINCGMSGIARYNAWSSAFFLFFICLEGVTSDNVRAFQVRMGLSALGLLLTGSIVCSYGICDANRTSWLSMTPVARFVCDKASCLYNPLHSTFYARVRHDPDVDFVVSTNMPAIEASMPVVYYAGDGFVRKVLASSADRQRLDSWLLTPEGRGEFLAKHLNFLGPRPRYLDFARHDAIAFAPEMPIGEALFFKAGRCEGKLYFIHGLSHTEADGTWTCNRQAVMSFKTSSAASRLHAQFDCHSFHHSQPVKIMVDGEVVFDGLCGNDGFSFWFENPGPGKAIRFIYELPEAASPESYGLSGDRRILGIFLRSLAITEDGTRIYSDDY